MLKSHLLKRLEKLLTKAEAPILVTPHSPKDKYNAKLLQDIFNYMWDSEMQKQINLKIYGTEIPTKEQLNWNIKRG